MFPNLLLPGSANSIAILRVLDDPDTNAMTQTSRSLTLESPVGDTGHLPNGRKVPTIARFAVPVRGPSNYAACLPLPLYRGTSCGISEQSTADVEATKNVLRQCGCVRYFLSGDEIDWARPCMILAELLLSPHAYQTNAMLAIRHGEDRSSLSAWRTTTRCGSVRYSDGQDISSLCPALIDC